jgi:putative ABC transport system permease protein
VLQTLGYRSSLVARLIVTEGLMLGLLGGVVGIVAAMLAVRFGHFSLSTDGLSISMTAGPMVLLIGLATSATLGVVAGLVPAVQASRREITECFRAV